MGVGGVCEIRRQGVELGGVGGVVEVEIECSSGG